MHEVSLVHALFDQTDRAIAPHPSTRVRLLVVRIGQLAGVECQLFRTAFDGCRQERGYTAAELRIVEEHAAWCCTVCVALVSPDGPLRCPACDTSARLSAGGELILDRIELELP